MYLYEVATESVCESAARLLFMSIKWAKSVPAFSTLSLQDQVRKLWCSLACMLKKAQSSGWVLTLQPQTFTSVMDFTSSEVQGRVLVGP